MKTSPTYSLFHETACLDKATALAYSRGTLSKEEKHAAETHLLDCELCTMAVAGIAAAGVDLNDLSALNKKIEAGYGSKSAFLSLKGILTGLAVLTVAAAAVLYFLPEKKSNTVTVSKAEEKNETIPDSEAQVKNDPSPVKKEADISAPNLVADNFIEPLKVPGQVSVFNPDMVSNTVIPPPNPQFVPGADLLDNSFTTPALPLFKQEYNSSVKYIRSLKISNYDKLYFDYRFRSKNVYGVPSPYASEESRNKDMFAEPVREIKADKVLDQALAFYRSEKFGAANAKFALLLSYNLSDENALFYSGLCHYHLKQYASASKCLNAILSGENNVFHQEAKWYLALTNIEEGKVKEAENLLTQIIVQNGFYRQQAEEKLKEILK